MPNVEANIAKECVILPFSKKDKHEDQPFKRDLLAALIAVTVLHDAKESAEERLMEIIERSGEVEILDADEAYADLGLEELDVETGVSAVSPANDNAPFEVL